MKTLNKDQIWEFLGDLQYFLKQSTRQPWANHAAITCEAVATLRQAAQRITCPRTSGDMLSFAAKFEEAPNNVHVAKYFLQYLNQFNPIYL